ncbi:MAG: hypothetical protein K6A44_04835 [bacterium]|nr:hypothetical protein [bacterium]
MAIQAEHNNRFYKTFTPFITEKTQTAEKTIDGKRSRREFHPPYKFSKEFYSYMTAGGLLAFPVLALAISQKNIFAAMKKADIEIFKSSMDTSKGFFQNLSYKIAIAKRSFLSQFWGFIKPTKIRREKFALNLKAQKDKTLFSSIYNGVNGIFKRFKRGAAQRRYKQLSLSFNELEKSIETRLKIFEESADGKVKILFPKSVLRQSAEEIPRTVDLSRTATGKNRAQEARKIMEKIKQLLNTENVSYEEILQKITFSCEDVFARGEAKLSALRLTLQKQGIDSAKTDELLRRIYENFVRYRFAEKTEGVLFLPANLRRATYLASIHGLINEMKGLIPKSQTVARTHISSLEHLVSNRAHPSNMGLLEQLRQLLKCNDIVPVFLQDGKHTSLYKQYAPEDYMLLKREITDFAHSLKFAHKTQKHLLPGDLFEIDRGGVFTKGLAVAAPATLLGINIWNSKPGEEKAKSKRNFYSFIVGSAVMLASNYCTMNSQKRSIAYGILSAFLTSRIAERYIKN